MRRFLVLGYAMAGILFAVGSVNANSDSARLCRAAYTGDGTTVRQLLDAGGDVAVNVGETVTPETVVDRAN